jgi:hypothetical protein
MKRPASGYPGQRLLSAIRAGRCGCDLGALDHLAKERHQFGLDLAVDTAEMKKFSGPQAIPERRTSV